jgi:hypothetical protein
VTSDEAVEYRFSSNLYIEHCESSCLGEYLTIQKASGYVAIPINVKYYGEIMVDPAVI